MPPLSQESKHIRAEWKVGSLNIELWSNSESQWYDAKIVNIEMDGGEEWLEVAVDELNLSKQVLRYSRQCRPPGYPEEADDDTDDEEWESSETYVFDEEEIEEEEFSSDEIDDENWIEPGVEVVVVVNRANYTKCNGKYIQSGYHNGQPVWIKKEDENYMLKRNDDRCWEIVEIDEENDEEVILYNTLQKSFQPPINNWEKVVGDWPAPGLQFKFIEPEKHEVNPDELVDEFKGGYKTFEFTIDARPFGVRFAHSRDEMFLIVDLVGSGTPGETKGIRAHDVLETINGTKYENSRDALQLWRSLELPFQCTFKREKPKMQVLQVVRGGYPGLNGYYSLAGVCEETGMEQYFKSDDPSFKIVCTTNLRQGDMIEVEDGEEEEIMEDADEWCFFKEMVIEEGAGDEEEEVRAAGDEDPEPEEHEIYTARCTRLAGFPPAYGWDVADEEIAEFPGPGVIRHTVYPKAPKRVRITNVEAGINEVTVHFDTSVPPVPNAAPHMTYQYKIFPYPKLPGQPEMITSLDSPVIFPGLKNGQDYTFKIKAENQIFLASLSKESTTVRPLSLPTAKIKKLEGGDCKITVHFDDTGAEAADMMTSGWTVTTDPPTKEMSATRSPIIFDGLTNGETYMFILTARNSVGEATDQKSAMPLQPPPRPHIRKVEGGGILTRDKALRGLHIHCKVFVECPNFDDELIQSYVVIESIPESYKVKVTDISQPIIIPDLINGEIYKFKATAVNSTARVASDWSKPCQPTGPPRTPKIIRVEPRISGALIHFECEDKAVPEYKCMYKIRANLKIPKLEVTQSPVYVPNLENGKDYRLQVRSQNKISIEVPSRWSKKIYPVAWPPTPTKAEITKSTKDYIQIEWKCLPSVTKPMYRGWYEVKTIPETVTLQVTKCKAKLKGLDPNVKYEFKVVACNAVGRSDGEPYEIDKDLSINQYWNPNGYVPRKKTFRMGEKKMSGGASSVKDRAAAFKAQNRGGYNRAANFRAKRKPDRGGGELPAPMGRPMRRKSSKKAPSIQDKIKSINSKLDSSASKLYKHQKSPTPTSAPKPPRTWAKSAQKPTQSHQRPPIPPSAHHARHSPSHHPRPKAPPVPRMAQKRATPLTRLPHGGPPQKSLPKRPNARPAPPTRKKTTHNLLAMARHQHNKSLAKPEQSGGVKFGKRHLKKVHTSSSHMNPPEPPRERAPSRGLPKQRAPRHRLKKQKTFGNVHSVASRLNIFEQQSKKRRS